MASYLPTVNGAIGGAIGGLGVAYLAQPPVGMDMGSIAAGAVVGIVGSSLLGYVLQNYGPASLQPQSGGGMAMEVAVAAALGAGAVFLANMASGGAVLQYVDRM